MAARDLCATVSRYDPMRTDPVRDLRHAVGVHDTAPRLLRLLTLLVSRSRWTTTELARRLEVTPRTVRRDVDRLRRLDYRIEGRPGPGGGYRLQRPREGRLPPLVLDDEEAVALAVALRMAGLGGVAGVPDAAETALAKLERLLPQRLQSRVTDIGGSVNLLDRTAPTIDAEMLIAVSEACRRRHQLRIAYTDARGRQSIREIEPLAAVRAAGRWYLAAFDPGRDDWRTFRIDRIDRVRPLAIAAAPREHPDPASLVQTALAVGPYEHTAQIRIHAPMDDAERLVSAATGVLVDEGASCVLTAGAHDLRWLAWYLISLEVAWTVIAPAELVEEARHLLDHACQQLDGAASWR